MGVGGGCTLPLCLMPCLLSHPAVWDALSLPVLPHPLPSACLYSLCLQHVPLPSAVPKLEDLVSESDEEPEPDLIIEIPTNKVRGGEEKGPGVVGRA